MELVNLGDRKFGEEECAKAEKGEGSGAKNFENVMGQGDGAKADKGDGSGSKNFGDVKGQGDGGRNLKNEKVEGRHWVRQPCQARSTRRAFRASRAYRWARLSVSETNLHGRVKCL